RRRGRGRPGAAQPVSRRLAPRPQPAGAYRRDDWPCPPLPALLPERRRRCRDRQRSPDDAAAANPGDGRAASSQLATRQLATGRLELGGLGSALLLTDSGQRDGDARSSGGLSMRFSPSVYSSLHSQPRQQPWPEPEAPIGSPADDRRSLSSAASPRPGYTMGLLTDGAGSGTLRTG
uniref:Protein kinase domain-containing protein n=1 Tax=Macrostomum lignano TaxID=282301 RepID=A0A1I8GVG2_9PLAT